MPDLAWDELLQQEEAEELQAGCIVRKKLFSKAVSFGLSVPLPLETGQGCAVPFCCAMQQERLFPYCFVLCCSVWQHPRVLQRDMYHVSEVEI